VKLRTRVFCLAASTTVAALVGTLALSLAAGRSSFVSASLASLTRESERTVAALDGALGALRDFDAPLSAGAFPPSLGSIRSFIDGRGGEILRASTDLELAQLDGRALVSRGLFSSYASPRDRPEWVAAVASGAAYVLRRIGGRLCLFYSASMSIQGSDLVVSLATGMEALELYEREQLVLFGAAGALAAALLLGAAYALSLGLARSLEELAERALGIAGGDYASRVAEGGGEETASLARSFNRMAEAVQEEVSRLEAEKADRQAFVDDLTHELRTPVTSIVGFAELLRARAWDEEESGRCLERIGAEGRRVLELTESLKRLLVARSSARVMEEVEVAGLLLAAAEEGRARAGARGIGIEVESARGSIRCDPSLLSMALRNLLDNSIRASAPGGRILLGFERSETAARMYVRDFAGGMSDEEMAAAGRPFRKRRGEGAGREGGFGLGLAICKEIADGHGAELRLERPEGGGLLAALVFANLPPVYREPTAP
jgi:signal transduction histidine kinase